jgi:phosphatidylserine decarboxylase
MGSFKSSIASSMFGKFANCEFPSLLQNLINRVYVKLMKVDLSDFESIQSYKTLNALFTRALKTPRDFDKDEAIFISPCDAFISESGKIKEAKALQIKAHEYRVRELLGTLVSKECVEKIVEGDFLNFYLSPRDYHRYHVPIDMRIAKAVHIPGKLYPVNFTWLSKIPELFVENERVVLECYTKDEKVFYMVFVGALNVGKMSFVFDASIQTNAKKTQPQLYTYENLYLKKSQELGRFEMGSTIVMLFEKESVELTCTKDNSIRFCDTIAKKIN